MFERVFVSGSDIVAPKRKQNYDFLFNSCTFIYKVFVYVTFRGVR